MTAHAPHHRLPNPQPSLVPRNMIVRIATPRDPLTRGHLRNLDAGGTLRSLFFLLLTLTAAAAFAAEPDLGVLPTDAAGKPLNFDFETGTLQDWTASGDAF